MGRVKGAITLKQSCINTIARHFDRMWAQDFEKQFGDVPRLLHVISPFDDLPGHLCSDILHTLLQLRPLRKSHLQLLLVPHITSLNFSASCANSVPAQALEIMPFRCKRLTSLNLTNCMSVSAKLVVQCVSSLPVLRTLILKQTKINDYVLKAVACHLPQLTHLDLHACPVTDRGAQWLCGDHGDFEPVCTDLALLDISATKIDLTGCCSILQCFSKLCYLHYPDSIEAVACLHREGACYTNSRNSKSTTVNGPRPGTSGAESVKNMCTGNTLNQDHHRLEVLHATALRCRRIEPDSVRLACHHCPYVRELYFYQDATDEALRHLVDLQHLRVLEVTSDKPQAVTFHAGLLPLLQARGPEMVALGLYDIHAVDLGLVGWLCPKLQRLKVVSMNEDANFAHAYLTAQQQAAGFQVLRQLTMVFGVELEGSSQVDSDLLLRTPALRQLHLIRMTSLTDEVLDAALCAHGFACLEKVQLESCDELTVESITRLVACCSQLTHLSLKHCHNITYHDYQELTSFIKKERLDISVDWE